MEILSEIFLLIVKEQPLNREHLMLVCQRWHAVMLSIPGIHSQLRIRRATQKEVVQAFIQGRRSRLDVTIDMKDERDGNAFDVDNFHACFIAAAEAAPRWRSLKLISPPPHGQSKDLQILRPLEHLESFKLAEGFGKFLKPVMMWISRTATPHLTTMELADPVAVLCLAQPACLHVYRLSTSSCQRG